MHYDGAWDCQCVGIAPWDRKFLYAQCKTKPPLVQQIARKNLTLGDWLLVYHATPPPGPTHCRRRRLCPSASSTRHPDQRVHHRMRPASSRANPVCRCSPPINRPRMRVQRPRGTYSSLCHRHHRHCHYWDAGRRR
jgi:hypothetical protein